ncbi:unnamed protein product [Peniophora sp. CBMAI 1063]|nr:unnamed protein product [Peniophora sp. CBMAI 1063]
MTYSAVTTSQGAESQIWSVPGTEESADSEKDVFGMKMFTLPIKCGVQPDGASQAPTSEGAQRKSFALLVRYSQGTAHGMNVKQGTRSMCKAGCYNLFAGWGTLGYGTSVQYS